MVWNSYEYFFYAKSPEHFKNDLFLIKIFKFTIFD